MSVQPSVLQFGIPTLDELIGKHRTAAAGKSSSYDPGEFGIDIRWDGGLLSTSLCIMGPDGTGKSILALHMAARYMADCSGLDAGPDRPRVIYASTDLPFQRAHQIWRDFRLDEPNKRQVPFLLRPSEHWNPRDLRVNLKEYHPGPANGGDNALAEHLQGSKAKAGDAEIAFINLAAGTAGDDWGYLTRVLALLESPNDPQSLNNPKLPNGPHTESPPHLLIIDAVEGLEVFVGEHDAFGQQRSRRSRIAQVLRTAAGKCHVVLVVEESGDGKRLAEEFVADVVIRLRAVSEEHYSRRTVEIIKARAQAHTRGQHDYVIRDGRGSSTGRKEMQNPDDPLIADNEGTCQAYFHVFTSIHSLYRRIMTIRKDGQSLTLPVVGSPPTFGVHYLDNMLGAETPTRLPVQSCGTEQERSAASSVTALIGDDGTHKSRLGRAFLSRCFAQRDQGVAILLTTQLIDADELSRRMKFHLSTESHKYVESGRVVCRRLEIHQTSSALLFHIVESVVMEARKILGQSAATERGRWEGSPACAQIRLVIDDWSTIKATYPDVARDPLFLPFLMHYLQRQQIAALIIDTQPGGPDSIIRDEVDRELRALAHNHLYTWHVRFFGENLVAIAAIPPISDAMPPIIRELRPARSPNEEELIVDPHFELYMGLVEGTPELVPLRVQLYAETPSFVPYFVQANEFFGQLFRGHGGHAVIQSEGTPGYERLRDLSYVQNDAKLDHTLVFQVDEFWMPNRSGYDLHRQCQYMSEYTTGADYAASPEDPYRVFQVPASMLPTSEQPQARRRCEFFALKKCGYAEQPDESKPDLLSFGSIPYMWDFGFLLCREGAWLTAENGELLYPTERCRTVKDVWTALQSGRPPSWWEFLQACRIVAGKQMRRGASEPVYAFDIDMRSIESFSCAVMEVWASEISILRGQDAPDIFPKLRGIGQEWGLIELLEDPQCAQALYRALLILGGVFAPRQFQPAGFEFESRVAFSTAVAARHWYSTASDETLKWESQDPAVPLRLPGHYSVRGDWFLATASGSLSPRLGFRAIDLLTSSRSNITRLQLGIGLPTRKIDSVGRMRTALYTTGNQHRNREVLLYDDLLALGGHCSQDDEFSWLWRSNLRNYHRHARIWGKWLCWIVQSWERRLFQENISHVDGFRLYSELLKEVEPPVTKASDPSTRGAPRAEEIMHGVFKNRCEFLVSSLRNATAAGSGTSQQGE